jgi:hypothetical protein
MNKLWERNKAQKKELDNRRGIWSLFTCCIFFQIALKKGIARGGFITMSNLLRTVKNSDKKSLEETVTLRSIT